MKYSTKCKICNNDSYEAFKALVLFKYQVKYYHCIHCEFLQTENPYWLNEAYVRPINLSDTGYMARNIAISKKMIVLLYLLFGTKGSYLDYAAGYGTLVRLMRDVGFDFYWKDKYTKNLFACGFEWSSNLKVNAVTAFEVFEHFVNPIDEIESLLKISNTIIFSTELYPVSQPKPQEWWYFGLEHGQHVSFFSHKTLEYIAKKYNLNYYSVLNIKVL